MCKCLFFTKLLLSSLWINRVAASAFSVYLLHCNMHLLGTFKMVNQYLIAFSAIYILAFLIALFFFSVFIDQVRIFSFKYLSRSFK